MKRALCAASIALSAAGIWTWSTVIYGACQDGQVPCMRHGCRGVRECIGGRWTGCEVPDTCLVAQVVPRDTVVIQLVVPGSDLGMTYDGADAAGPFNDRGAIVAGPPGTLATKVLPNVRAPAFGNSLIVFARSRQPQLVRAPWTMNVDTIQTQLLNNLRFNVTFWILAGDFAVQRDRATAAVLAVNNAYTVERAGIRIGWATVTDATADPDAAALLGGGSINDFRNNIGFEPREINVYVVDTVSGSPTMGVNFDGTPVIVLGRDSLTFPQLLEHELGHAFVLWHVGAPDYNFENVMVSSVSAHFLTEGQTFRMHFHPSSQLNVFGLRPGLPTFICAEQATNDCPAGSRRLWADGAMPPN